MVRLPGWKKRRGQEAEAVEKRLEDLLEHQSTLPEDVQIRRKEQENGREPLSRPSKERPILRIRAKHILKLIDRASGNTAKHTPPPGSWCYFMMLGLPPDATQAQVEQAYRRYVAVMHPDRYTYNPEMRAHEERRLSDLNKFMAQMRKRWAQEAPGGGASGERTP